MKKTYIIPNEKIAELGADECLLADSNTGAGGYDGTNNPSEDGDGMDEDKVKAQNLWDTQW